VAAAVSERRLGTRSRLSELLSYRELIVNLTARDLRFKYRRSVLGAAWSLLNPLIMMAIYALIFGVFTRFIVLPQYWAFLLTGLLPWLFFANSLGSATTSLTGNQSLVAKVHFPFEALTVATVLANLVNFLISLVVLLPVLVIAGRPLGPSLVMLPVVIVCQVGLAIGLGVMVAAVTVYLRDLEYLVGLGLTALFYLTPVLYPLSVAGHYAIFLRLNPMTWYVEGYHAALYWGSWPDWRLTAAMVVGSVVAIVGGYLVFSGMRDRIPEEV
jgi:ABC-2 type transport system permease protein